jgi:hypothetical protein
MRLNGVLKGIKWVYKIPIPENPNKAITPLTLASTQPTGAKLACTLHLLE